MQCDLCGKFNYDVFITYKQIAGEFKRVRLCPDCKIKHDKELEMCRENFRRQTEE